MSYQHFKETHQLAEEENSSAVDFSSHFCLFPYAHYTGISSAQSNGLD